MHIKVYLFFFLTFTCSFIFSQENEQEEKKKWVEINGYIKYLPSVSFLYADNILTDNLIHNRINLRSDFNENLFAKVDFRNRVFYGERVKLSPSFGESVDIDNGEVDLSFLWVDKKAIAAHTIIDRAYLDYNKGKWEIRAGRQRINWGVNLLWNSNDLFNSYNFVNFDYEERPGSDAIRVQYHTKKLTDFDLAYKPGEDLDHSIVAGMYKFNKWTYDIQLLAANYWTDYAIGTGWAGNLKQAGFKGEATYFHPKKNLVDTTGILSTSTSIDYSLKNGIYLNATFLYNSQVDNQAPIQGQIFSNELSAKNLMPTKYSYFLQASGALNPMLTSSFAVIYGQDLNLLFFMPSLAYSIKENWDIDLTGQVFYGEQNDDFKNLGNAVFLRFRYSY